MLINKNHKISAFTLVELAIVLVIIGLLVGGVVGGQTLIKQAQLKSMNSDIRGFITSQKAFELEYDWMPGDIPNAYDYWGANCDASASKCNGDGNKVLNARSEGPPPAPTAIDDNEVSRYWQHLSLAGIIKGNYPGNIDPGNDTAAPKFAYNNAGIMVNQSLWAAAVGSRNSIIYSIGKRTNTRAINAPVFSTADSYNLDKKFDDGLPDQGNITTYISGWTSSNSPNCKTGTDPNSTYNLSYTGAEACLLVYKVQ